MYRLYIDADASAHPTAYAPVFSGQVLSPNLGALLARSGARSASSQQPAVPSDISFALGRDRHCGQRYDYAVLRCITGSTSPSSHQHQHQHQQAQMHNLALDRPDSDRTIICPLLRPPDRLMGGGSLFWAPRPATTGHGSYTSQTSTRIINVSGAARSSWPGAVDHLI